jgi:HNH endonuclease
MHYQRWRFHGDPLYERTRARCVIAGCGNGAIARGWCPKHYTRWRDHGDPLYVPAPTPVADRFWSYVDRRGADECWPWTGSCTKGYGTLRIGGRGAQAPRLSWEIHCGPIPGGMWILHHCDNPPCVNPAHLFLGTVDDNNNDKIQKGRQRGAVGDRNGMAKLTEAQVREIRVTYVKGDPQFGCRALSRQYGVSPTVIRRIVTRVLWKHLGETAA